MKSICRELTVHGLQIAPASYFERLDKPATARQQRDARLMLDIARVRASNYGAYEARKSLPDVEP